MPRPAHPHADPRRFGSPGFAITEWAAFALRRRPLFIASPSRCTGTDSHPPIRKRGHSMHAMIKRPSTTLAAAALCAAATVAANGQFQPINESFKIVPGDGGPMHEFGCAVSIDQGVIAVGSRHDDHLALDAGSASLYSAVTGIEITKLLASDGVAGDTFGFSIDMHNGLVVVGAPHAGVGGAAYVFDATTGTQLVRLEANDVAAGDEFGYAVAIHGGTVAVGARADDDLGQSSGSAYLFDALTGAQLGKLLPETAAANQSFGVSIAMDDGLVAVGARSYFVLGEGFTLGTVHDRAADG